MPPASDVIGSWHPHSCVSHWLKSHLEVNLVFLPKFPSCPPAEVPQTVQRHVRNLAATRDAYLDCSLREIPLFLLSLCPSPSNQSPE